MKLTLTIVLVTSVFIERSSSQEDLYFPNHDGKWGTVTAEKAGLRPELIKAALDLSFANNSTSVVVLYDGRIVAEKHVAMKGNKQRTLQLGRMAIGVTDEGHSVEDVASVQKSVASILMGIAVEKKLVQLQDPVSKYLKQGWSAATPQQESRIQVRHLLAMTSGLGRHLKFETGPGVKWAYNTAAYARVMLVIEAATQKNRHEITRQWLTQPIGMSDSRWVKRPSTISNASGNGFGFATSARDLARLGVLIQRHGKWKNQVVYKPAGYFKEMTESSQQLNPSYGFLWWLNGKAFSIRANGTKRQGSRMAGAPDDMFDASGAMGRKLYVIPSKKLIITRIGGAPPDRQYPSKFLKFLFSG